MSRAHPCSCDSFLMVHVLVAHLTHDPISYMPVCPSGSCPSFCPACFEGKSPSFSSGPRWISSFHFLQGNLTLSAHFLPRRSSPPQQLAASKVLLLDPTESSLEITFCRLGLSVCGPNKAFPEVPSADSAVESRVFKHLAEFAAAKDSFIPHRHQVSSIISLFSSVCIRVCSRVDGHLSRSIIPSFSLLYQPKTSGALTDRAASDQFAGHTASLRPVSHPLFLSPYPSSTTTNPALHFHNPKANTHTPLPSLQPNPNNPTPSRQQTTHPKRWHPPSPRESPPTPQST